MKLKNVVVGYHSPCMDGALSALAAHLWAERAGVRADAYPLGTSEDGTAEALAADVGPADDVLLLDTIGRGRFALELAARCRSVTVLDHHKTALARRAAWRVAGELPGNLRMLLSEHRCGATLTWRVLGLGRDDAAAGAVAREERKRLARVYAYVQDADLWSHALPGTRAFAAGFAALGLDLDARENPALFGALRNLDADKLIADGAPRVAADDAAIAAALPRAFRISLPIFSPTEAAVCLAVEAHTDLARLRSELGHSLAVASSSQGLRPLAAVVLRPPELRAAGRVRVSLRSLALEDTTRISEPLGGGGHRNASAFVVDERVFDEWTRF